MSTPPPLVFVKSPRPNRRLTATIVAYAGKYTRLRRFIFASELFEIDRRSVRLAGMRASFGIAGGGDLPRPWSMAEDRRRRSPPAHPNLAVAACAETH